MAIMRETLPQAVWCSRWLWVILFILPLAAFPATWSIEIDKAKNAVFILGALCLVGWQVENWIIRAFLAWAIVSFVWAGGTVWAMAGLLGLLAWVLIYAAVGQLSPRQWNALKWPIAGAASFQIGWMAMQASGYDPVFIPVAIYGVPMPYASPIIAGWFGNPTDAALFLGLCLPFLPRVHWGLALLVSLVIVGWLGSSAGFLAVVMAWFWWIGLRRWWWSFPLAVAALAGWVLHLDTNNLINIKSTIWGQAWQIAQLSPWVGWGPNAVDYSVYFLQPKSSMRWNFAFNEWLQAAVEFGFVGVGLLAVYAGNLAYRTWRSHSIHGSLVLSVLILGATTLFSIPFRIGPTAMLAALYLGRLDAETRRP